MSYSITYDLDLEKVLRKIPKNDAKFIKEKIENLANNPRSHGAIKLSGKELYRIRHGDYRIIYQIIDAYLIVLVLDVDGRKNVYRK